MGILKHDPALPNYEWVREMRRFAKNSGDKAMKCRSHVMSREERMVQARRIPNQRQWTNFVSGR